MYLYELSHHNTHHSVSKFLSFTSSYHINHFLNYYFFLTSGNLVFDNKKEKRKGKKK